jgi:DNA-binding GntR family transcriptional regulator
MRSLSLRGGIERSLTEHAAIIDAVERRDTQAAVGLLSEHIQVPQRILQTSPEEEMVQAGGH